MEVRRGQEVFDDVRAQENGVNRFVTANHAVAGPGGRGGAAGGLGGGLGGTPGGAAGLAHPGNRGSTALSGAGIGGGFYLATGGTVSIDNTTITGNSAATSNNDVFGTFTT